MSRGYFSLVLHAHLPFVRHPEHAEFLEEKWYFEAVAECYLPLLDVFERLAREGVPFRAAISLSPTLVAMMDDPLLRERCRRYLTTRLAAAASSRDWVREAQERALAEFERCCGDLFASFSALHRSGHLELLTTAATHGFLPLLKGRPSSVQAQIAVAADEQRQRLGAVSAGFWLPECGYYPSLESIVARQGYRYFILDAHGMPSSETSFPVDLGGVSAFGRDPDASREIWGPTGYPSSPIYRDFHAVDASGFKVLAVTGSVYKKDYDPVAAANVARLHARQFIASRLARLKRDQAGSDQPPILIAAYDAELFGHWWHEGPVFLEHALRECAQHREVMPAIGPADYLDRHGPGRPGRAAASSWGQHGFNEFWLNPTNRWIYPEIRQAEAQLQTALQSEGASTPLGRRATQQAARSLLLAQASDWPFIMVRGASAAYAEKRLRDQLARVHFLCASVLKGEVDESRLAALEHMDRIFPNLDVRRFQERSSCAEV